MSAPHVLQIQHQPDVGVHHFRVVRQSDGKSGDAVEIPSPFDHPVPGLPESNLMRELRWYLEEFLDYPFPPETTRAERLVAALKDWGRTAFGALFGRQPPEESLAIVADEPSVFGWPWEALADEQGRWVCETCGLLRRPSSAARVTALPDALARDRVRILLVIARSGANDVRFRSLARPVVELIEGERLPAEIEVLRPPTFRHLGKHLQEQNRAGRPYHLVHFDGHGHSGLCPDPKRRDGRRTGWLLFEDTSGDPDWIDAERFSRTLSEHGVPAVVLNACQSAMIDEEDAAASSASVAHALLRAGVRAVVAMSYSVYVSAARVFMPAFYRQMFATGRLSDAVHAGRRALHDRPGRVCPRGTFPLRDDLVPVLYQQAPLAFDFAAQARREETAPSQLPDEARQGFDSAGFVGRDGEILQLERALHDPHRSAILIQGMGGQGKTSLAKAFLRWLEQTGGLGDGVFWFSFEACRNVEAFFNRLGEQLFGPDFGRQKWEERLRQVTAECRKRRLRIVWDNFESVRGVPGTAVAGLLPDEDAAALRQFLLDLREARSKVLITSRSPEAWLDPQSVLRLRALGGLDGEERWELAGTLLTAQGLTLHLEEPALRELIGALDGHPLSMRVILPKLRERQASELTAALRDNVKKLRSAKADAEEVRLFAMLKLATDDLPEAWRSLLLGFALHEGFVDGNFLELMAQVDADCTRDMVDAFLGALATGGLLRDHGQAIFEMHPALVGFLRITLTEGTQRQAWGRAFIEIMGSVADKVAPLPMHQQRGMVHWHQASFQSARRAAFEVGMHDDCAALTQALAVFAQHRRDFRTAAELYLALADHQQQRGGEAQAAGAYHQLGVVAQEQRDLATARDWYLKSLAIEEKHGNEHGAALSYHGLARVAEEQGDLATARDWCLKSLAIWEKQGDEPHTAMTYHQLGILAEEERALGAARDWYLKSLAIEAKQSNEHGAALSYHGLARVAEEQGDLATARGWYLKSLAIWEKQGNEHHAAMTYHHLGRVAQEERDFAAAREWFLKSLATSEKQSNEHDAAISYHGLARVAQEQGDLATARDWYLKSLAINEKQGDEPHTAMTYHQLGVVAQQQGDLGAAREWYLKSLTISEKQGNEHHAAISYHQLGRVAEEQGDFASAHEWYLKSLAIEDKHGNERGAALSHHQLGTVAQEQGDFATAREWYLKSLAIKERLGDEHLAASTYSQLGALADLEGRFPEATTWLLRAIHAFAKTKDLHGVRRAANIYRAGYRASPEGVRPSLRQLWVEASIDPAFLDEAP